MLQWILQNISEKQAFQRTAKFIEMKSIGILVKVDEMHNILKTLLATGNWSSDEGGIGLPKFLLELLLRPYFIKGPGFISLSRFFVTVS